MRDILQTAPGPGEVLIQMKASGICRSDMVALRMTKAQVAQQPNSNPFGHELCDAVTAITGIQKRRPLALAHSLYPAG